MDSIISADLIRRAQAGDRHATDEVVSIAERHCGPLRRYMGRNILIDDEDLPPIFLGYVYQLIPTIRLDVGDPGRHLLTEAKKRTLVEITKSIASHTEQVCNRCGHEQRLNYTRNTYRCPFGSDGCDLKTTIYETVDDLDAVEDGKATAKTHVPVRFTDMETGDTLCRCAKRLNKYYYCMKSFSDYINAIRADCINHHDRIIVLIQDGGMSYEDAEAAFDEGIKLSRVQAFHSRYLPDNWHTFRCLLTRISLAVAGRQLQCTKCGSMDISTRMTSTSDEVGGEDADGMSIASDYTADTEDQFAIIDRLIPDERITEYVGTLFGREREVMELLLDGERASDIASILGIKPVSVSRYKRKAIDKAAEFFHKDFIGYFSVSEMEKFYERFPWLAPQAI